MKILATELNADVLFALAVLLLYLAAMGLIFFF